MRPRRSNNNGRQRIEILISVNHLKNQLKKYKAEFIEMKGIINRLCKSKLITEYVLDEKTLKITFKNEQIKRCLTKAGQVLEMFIYINAKEVTDTNGNIVYNDVMNGVCIDWDGEIHTDETVFDTENEIDIMMMYGIVPVFVSCKNGIVGVDELYKLNSVAERFGGQYAKKF